ncbi:MAG: hypothetical protein KF693_13595 [Nitrospira sp.]|nr:hypothetical protein [Nitrospira sp.]
MRGYLLDLNHIAAWHSEIPGFMAKLRTVPPDTQIRACTITLGECEAGRLMTKTTDHNKRDAYRAFIVETFNAMAIEVTISTAQMYGTIMSRIWHKHPPANPKIKTESHLVNLGVDVNDVWIFAVAYDHGLTLLTTDRMAVLKECIPDAKTDNWLS